MKQIKIVLFFLALGLIFYNINIYAAEIYTQEGARFAGEIAEETEETITLKSEQGTIILNRRDILHIEHEAKEACAPEGSYSERLVKFWKKISKNNFLYVRRNLYKKHYRFFTWLEKRKIYQTISLMPSIAKYRKDNPGAYILAVYMVCLLILGLVLSFLERYIRAFFCKVFHRKQRYDL